MTICSCSFYSNFLRRDRLIEFSFHHPKLTVDQITRFAALHTSLALRFGLCFGGSRGSGGKSVGDQLLGALGVFFGHTDFFR